MCALPENPLKPALLQGVLSYRAFTCCHRHCHGGMVELRILKLLRAVLRLYDLPPWGSWAGANGTCAKCKHVDDVSKRLIV